MTDEQLTKIRKEIGKALDINLVHGAAPIKKIETENILAYWVGPNIYRIDIKVN